MSQLCVACESVIDSPTEEYCDICKKELDAYYEEEMRNWLRTVEYEDWLVSFYEGEE